MNEFAYLYGALTALCLWWLLLQWQRCLKEIVAWMKAQEDINRDQHVMIAALTEALGVSLLSPEDDIEERIYHLREKRRGIGQ